MSAACRDCGIVLATPRKGHVPSGYCRVCAPKHKWTAALRAKVAEGTRKRHERERSDPAKHQKKVESGNRLRRLHPSTPEMVQKQNEGRRRSFWVPEGYEELNRKLKAQRFTLTERKAIVAEAAAADERKRRAAMTWEERAAERLANGATIVPTFKARRADHDFTLGGVASGL